jgi:hypothetical protein
MIRVEIAGLDAVETRLLELPKEIESKVLRYFADFVHEKALDRADKHTQTGALFQSLYSKPIPHGYEIGNDPQRAPHAVFVHWGTRPHIIMGKPVTPYKVYPKPPNKILGGIFAPFYVKRQKTLRWAAGGKFIFANTVKHPGYKGDPYLADAAREAIRNFDAIVQQATKGI